MQGLSRLRNMFRVPDLRNKILFTIFIIAIFRLGSHIPVPYVDFRAIKELKDFQKWVEGPLFGRINKLDERIKKLEQDSKK